MYALFIYFVRKNYGVLRDSYKKRDVIIFLCNFL